jgi:hypothetical protein
MERIAAFLVRWGAALSLLVVIGYFSAQRWIEVPAEGDIGVRLGLVVVAVSGLIVLASLVVIGAIGLWYGVLVKGASDKTRYENERVVGTAFLIIAAVIAVLVV